MSIPAIGKEFIISQLIGMPLSRVLCMAIGTGTPSATALGNEVNRHTLNQSSASGNVVTYRGEWSIDDNISASVTEAGIFDSETPESGSMLCSESFATITKGVNDSLVITWEITLI